MQFCFQIYLHVAIHMLRAIKRFAVYRFHCNYEQPKIANCTGFTVIIRQPKIADCMPTKPLKPDQLTDFCQVHVS
jgi:hypothetical protein